MGLNHSLYISYYDIINYIANLSHHQISSMMNKIKEILTNKNLTQSWLSEKLGKSFNMVNGYLNNRRQPSIEVLYQIAELLNVEAKDLLVNNNQAEINEKK